MGQDEDPLPLVGSPDFTRAKYSPRRCVTKTFQFFDNFSESKADVAVDVFKETELGAQKSNSICDKGPEMPGIFRSKSISGGAEWLAGVASSKDVHAVTKVFPWEGFKIRPDRCWVHESRFHFRNQVGTREGFDLTKSDCAQSWEDSFKSKFNAAVSGTKAEVCNCLGSIHILSRLKERSPGRRIATAAGSTAKWGSKKKPLTLLSSLTVRCTNYPSDDSRAKANMRRLSAVFSVTLR